MSNAAPCDEKKVDIFLRKSNIGRWYECGEHPGEFDGCCLTAAACVLPQGKAGDRGSSSILLCPMSIVELYLPYLHVQFGSTYICSPSCGHVLSHHDAFLS